MSSWKRNWFLPTRLWRFKLMINIYIYIYIYIYIVIYIIFKLYLITLFVIEFRFIQGHLLHFSEIFQGCDLIFLVYNIHDWQFRFSIEKIFHFQSEWGTLSTVTLSQRISFRKEISPYHIYIIYTLCSLANAETNVK